MTTYVLDHPAQNNHYGWFVAVKGDPLRYLHDDLRVKNSTDDDARSSGYFQTRSEAYIAIAKFLLERQEADE